MGLQVSPIPFPPTSTSGGTRQEDWLYHDPLSAPLPEHRKLGNLTVTVKKTVPSPEAIQILYQRMKYEYEFYYYVKEQFHLLKRKFGLRSSSSNSFPRPEFAIPSPLETEEPVTEDEGQDDEKWLEDIYKR
uniref:Uncharacterized protein n=1 Tax=Sphaerodactylus townsendi TaxID=933632 RepID=A0ACB8GD22_9SAUR